MGNRLRCGFAKRCAPYLNVGHILGGRYVNVIYTMTLTGNFLEVYEDRVEFTRDVRGCEMTLGIPYDLLDSVQVKKAGILFGGHILFVTSKFSSKGGRPEILQFSGKHNNTLAIEIKQYIDLAINKLRNPASITFSDELQKLAELKQRGILSEEEFQAAKHKLFS